MVKPKKKIGRPRKIKGAAQKSRNGKTKLNSALASEVRGYIASEKSDIALSKKLRKAYRKIGKKADAEKESAVIRDKKGRITRWKRILRTGKL